MKFSDFKITKPLSNALKDLGFDTPTTIQEKAFSVIMSGRDVVGLAQTGTGKTFAFLLPILNIFKYSNQVEPRVIILVPTRELVEQIVDEAEKISKYMNVRIVGVYGGTNINTQKELLFQGLDILVATPGRLYDLALNGSLKLKGIQKIVIDEMDEMLNLGFRVQLNNILELLPERRQNLLFSATMTNDIEVLLNTYFNNPQKIEAAAHGTPLENILQNAYYVPNFNSKVNLINFLLSDRKLLTKILVFTKSKRIADLLFERICENFEGEIGIIHSNKSQNFRFNALHDFESGKNRILIATDLVSRGLDISDVSHVINFDMPDDTLNYIHRIGRTGRADKPGTATSFISPNDLTFQNEVELLMKLEIPRLEIPVEVLLSEELIEMEKPELPGKNYLANVKIKGHGAFHAKKKKNTKVNLGGSYKREIKLKYKKPKTRGSKK